MEQHPVPRNISGFQFHLIGDMTLRQFAYLAVGVVSAYLTFKMAPFPAIIKFPLTGIFGLTGFAFAFLPIQDRPLDKWLVAFFKSITSPTQYAWVKNNPPPEILTRAFSISTITLEPTHSSAHKEANEKLKTYLATLQKQPHEVLNTREKRYIDATLSLFQTHSVTPQPIVTQPVIQPSSPPPAPPVIKAAPPIAASPSIPTPALQPIAPLPEPLPAKPPAKEEAKPSVPSPVANPPKTEMTSMQKQLEQLALEKKRLEQELSQLKNQATQLKEPQVVKPAVAKDAPEPTIKAVSAKFASSEMGLSNFSQTPNLITGIVKDPQKKILPNIILTIKDKSSLPLRALKTNKLGQFATATPLSNGTYYLEAEDPLKRYVFDIAEIILSGKVFLPIEIIAKGEKELMREKLTKEIFGSNNANI